MGTIPVIARLRADAWSGLPAEVADYVDAGAGAEVTAGEAVAAWDRYRFLPHVLRDVSVVDTSVELLGTRLRQPILGAPTAYQRMVHPGGEAEMARGVAGAGGLLVVSTRSTVRLEDVAATGCPWWFQVYVMRRSLTEALVDRAVAAGAGALVLTGDTPYVGRKPRVTDGIPIDPTAASINVVDHLLPGEDADEAMDQDPAATLADIAWLAGRSGLPVLVKGVLRPDDAQACLDAGAAGIIVSNHGGRQLDRALSTAAALPAVVAAVAGRYELELPTDLASPERGVGHHGVDVVAQPDGSVHLGLDVVVDGPTGGRQRGPGAPQPCDQIPDTGPRPAEHGARPSGRLQESGQHRLEGVDGPAVVRVVVAVAEAEGGP
jgi:4-hydroxymandelate oxidase